LEEKKIPELMKGLGSGIKEFKKGVKEDAPDENPLAKRKSSKLED
jgi:Sec-independent protein translocase protein TatA